MFKGLIRRVTAAAVVAASAFVAVAALGVAVHALLLLVVVPAAAAAITALLFALVAGLTAFLFLGSGRDDDDDIDEEPEGLAGRLVHIVRNRPIVGAVGGLAAVLVMLRNPALAAIIASLVTERRVERNLRRR